MTMPGIQVLLITSSLLIVLSMVSSLARLAALRARAEAVRVDGLDDQVC